MTSLFSKKTEESQDNSEKISQQSRIVELIKAYTMWKYGKKWMKLVNLINLLIN